MPRAARRFSDAVAHGSAVAWRHLNLLGEYDFSEEKLRVWAEAASLHAGHVFCSMNNRHEFQREVLLPQNIMEAVLKYGRSIGVPHLAPHDLRRTFAKLAHKGRAALEQIQLSLGHASIVTTERYLGVRQDLHDAPCDRLGIRLG